MERFPQTNTALVIDDDAMMRLLVRETLAGSGMNVIEAADGETGIALFGHAAPDIVLLDVMMPGLDGYAVCRRLRELPAGLHTPIIMLTGLDDHESIARAFDAGATDFVSKPIPFPVLAHRVRFGLRAAESIAALADSEARLAHAQRIARLGTWQWEVEADRWQWSEEVQRIFRPAAGGDAVADQRLFLAAHAEDRDRVKRALSATVERGEPLCVQYRVVLPDDSERTVDVQAEIIPGTGTAGALVRGTVQDVTERARAAEKIRYLAYYDALTDLPNRVLLKDHLRYALAQAERHDRVVGTLFLDLDHFKRINDTLGHSAGDLLLQAVAERLKDCVRVSDRLARGDLSPAPVNVARMGGDEFIVVLSELAQPADAAKVAQRIIDSLAKPFQLQGHDVFVSASVGIALYPLDGKDEDALLMNADTAMYHAKEQGRNAYQFYSQSMNAKAFERLSLESHLRKALERDELELFYQPKIDTDSGRIAGAEALLRWRHPDMGLVSPAAFIPLAEETGLIIPIGEWVLAEACRQNRRWQDAGHEAIAIAINMSSPNFRQKNLLDLVSAALGDSAILPEHLEVEVTESMLMRDVDETVSLLKRLKGMGVRLAIDDFGTGYSSLSYLKRFPLDTLKIDRSFVKDIATNSEDKAIATAIVALAKSLGVEVVAEGVETAVQAQLLQGLGCNMMQGYLFSKPVPPAEFEALLRAGNSAWSTGAVPHSRLMRARVANA